MAIINSNEIWFGIVGSINEIYIPAGIPEIYISGVDIYEIGVVEISEGENNNAD
ncbi:MAG: hypothetical protein K2I00_02200 [Ruminococcus sp.]|nr:hypothetical protein [Ruminococcus sp.]